jgi:hypothetical protein
MSSWWDDLAHRARYQEADYQRGGGRLPPADRPGSGRSSASHIQILAPSDWFSRLPDEMHAEQRTFLRVHGLVG